MKKIVLILVFIVVSQDYALANEELTVLSPVVDLLLNSGPSGQVELFTEEFDSDNGWVLAIDVLTNDDSARAEISDGKLKVEASRGDGFARASASKSFVTSTVSDNITWTFDISQLSFLADGVTVFEMTYNDVKVSFASFFIPNINSSDESKILRVTYRDGEVFARLDDEPVPSQNIGPNSISVADPPSTSISITANTNGFSQFAETSIEIDSIEALTFLN